MTCPHAHARACHMYPPFPNGSPTFTASVCRCLDAPPVKGFSDPGEGCPGVPVVVGGADGSDVEDGGGLGGDDSLEPVPLLGSDGDVVPSWGEEDPVSSHGG